MVGQTVSHYRVLALLGSGGMGTVYRAEDLRLRRQVALKFLSADLTRDRSALDRFQREARAASALNHPHICTIHDIDEHDGAPFIAMELLEGQTLKERLHPAGDSSAPPLRLGEIVDLGLQLADALEAAHGKGIIHRDIKPANIFLTARGTAKLLDFGVAKLAAEPREPSEAPTYQSAAELRVDLEGLRRLLTSPVSAIPAGHEPLGLARDSLSIAERERASASRREQASIVVLPFENLSPDADNAFFADGLTEELIADLSEWCWPRRAGRPRHDAARTKRWTVIRSCGCRHSGGSWWTCSTASSRRRSRRVAIWPRGGTRRILRGVCCGSARRSRTRGGKRKPGWLSSARRG